MVIIDASFMLGIGMWYGLLQKHQHASQGLSYPHPGRKPGEIVVRCSPAAEAAVAVRRLFFGRIRSRNEQNGDAHLPRPWGGPSSAPWVHLQLLATVNCSLRFLSHILRARRVRLRCGEWSRDVARYGYYYELACELNRTAEARSPTDFS